MEILTNIKDYFRFKRWIRLRNKSKDKAGEKLCYCGHTYKCECLNPNKQLFLDSVKRKTIIECDKNNGWQVS